MQIRKLQWIRRPERVKITSSRTLTCECTSRHALVHTYEEDSLFECTFEKKEVKCGICIILSPDDGIMLMEREGHLEYVSDILDEHHKVNIPIQSFSKLACRKRGGTVTLLCDERQIVTFSFPSLEKSISVGIILEGRGSVTLQLAHTIETEQGAIGRS